MFLKLCSKMRGEISAKLVDIITLNPYSDKAHGACSLLDPDPKFGPATSIDAPSNLGLFKINSGLGTPSSRYLQS